MTQLVLCAVQKQQKKKGGSTYEPPSKGEKDSSCNITYAFVCVSAFSSALARKCNFD